MKKENIEKTPAEKLMERNSLWESIILDSSFSDKIKDEFLAIIRDRFGKGMPVMESRDDWIYFSISQLLVVVDKIAREENISREELMVLFENLRNDIWDFYKEINN